MKLLSGVAIVVLCLLWATLNEFCVDCIFLVAHRHGSRVRTPDMTLRTIAYAQVDFRNHDRDGNGKQDFWRGDIAGLYSMEGRDSQRIKLIEISLAAADDRPATNVDIGIPRSSKAGYWYRALRHRDETTPDPNRLAACAFPEDYPRSGRFTYVIDENNTVYKRDLGRPGGIEVYPSDEELSKDWIKY